MGQKGPGLRPMPATAQAQRQTSGQRVNSALPSAHSASAAFNGQQLNVGRQQPLGC